MDIHNAFAFVCFFLFFHANLCTHTLRTKLLAPLNALHYTTHTLGRFLHYGLWSCISTVHTLHCTDLDKLRQSGLCGLVDDEEPHLLVFNEGGGPWKITVGIAGSHLFQIATSLSDCLLFSPSLSFSLLSLCLSLFSLSLPQKLLTRELLHRDKQRVCVFQPEDFGGRDFRFSIAVTTYEAGLQ